MSNVDRIKRQLVRELVQDNVELLHGRQLARRVRRRHRLWVVARVIPFVLVAVALFGSSGVLSTLGEPPAAAPAVAAVVPAPVAAGMAPPAMKELALELTVPPEPVDAAVFPLAVRTIALDPGHGGESAGTRAPLGLVEKDLTLDIAERLRKLLEQQSFQVVMTRRDDRDVSLEQRGVLANREGADIFVSIHLNWIENRKSRGIETYYLGATDDPFLTRLAAAENRDSGYSMADMRRLLDRIYADVRQAKSRRLAEVVQGSLFESLGKVNPEIDNRGVKAAPFIVLLSTEMPAILAEVSCLSNEGEAQLLTKPLYRQYIAEALSKGIRAYAEDVEGVPETLQAGQKGS
ncbi:N-acetylmuramoyl-L-alanine amidase [bacterium]|nr:MAG: N-acetylmuramoyl-L-alanine amidase [bacterium]